jgi:hypothetical protein
VKGARGQAQEIKVIKQDTQDTENIEENKAKMQKGTKRDHIVGFVPIHIINLSLEEITMKKHQSVGTDSPMKCSNIEDLPVQEVHTVQKRAGNRENDEVFEQYLQGKLGHLTGEDYQVLRAVLRKYRHLFYQEGSMEIGCTSQVKHTIETGDARPIKKNPYRVPHALKSVVEDHIDDMLHKGIIEPSMSPWSSNIVLVQKKTKDGSIKYRFCVDYRALNAVTKPDAYPIPNIVDTLDSLGHSKIFSVLDMASGYHQIEIKPDDREKTAFSCHKGHYQFVKMPFGLNNAPATYQRRVDVILMG